ncbi:GxxExxY protein [Algoriphagus litoralis]|uniref:GxxExxY protein n=1 Tax=Algoriphagus litoralis TaxID=2202829 RepID=UPI000DB94119|nr:GxxExxY protein [Algoriphagus litoralis]
MKLTKAFLDELTYEINGAAIEVHRSLGPGLLEKVYKSCLAREFELRSINYQQELLIPVDYKGIQVNADLRCDFIIEDLICLELKAVKEHQPIFEAQLMTYLKLLNLPKGILYNFFVVNLFTQGTKTFVTKLFQNLPPH